MSVCVCLGLCCGHQEQTANGSESTLCVSACVLLLLELCHVCDKLTLIRQSHHTLGVCLWLCMSDIATGAVMAQSYASRVIRCRARLLSVQAHTHEHTCKAQV